MTPVVLESPYAGNVELNAAYARARMRDCLERGEAPYASHLLYTQPVLRDELPGERALGIEAGFVWRELAKRTVVYIDLGVSRGMGKGIADSEQRGCPVEYRELGPRRVAEVRSLVTSIHVAGCLCDECIGPMAALRRRGRR